MERTAGSGTPGAMELLVARACISLALPFLMLLVPISHGADLPDTIDALKTSVVGVGTLSYARRPAGNLLGTGFVVADGQHVVTNAHVVPKLVEQGEAFVAVFVGRGKKVKALRSNVLARDLVHDLAIIRFDGPAIDPLVLAADDSVREGELLAFTGYPAETLHGLHTVTHRGIVSSIFPVLDVASAESGDDEGGAGSRGEFHMLQLDATAFPGNSGSPLYRPEDGSVVGIVSKISKPAGSKTDPKAASGVTYAIPARHIGDILHRLGIRD